MGPHGDSANEPPATPGSLRAAVAILGLEATGLVILAVVDLVKIVTGTPRSAVYAAVGAGLTLVTAGVLVLLGRGLLRVRSWAFTPTLVLQALALPVGYSLAVQAGYWAYGGPVLLLALSGLGTLLAPPSRRALLTPR